MKRLLSIMVLGAVAFGCTPGPDPSEGDETGGPAEPSYYENKEVSRLQSSTKGDGIDLVIMGDGYTAADMVERTGKYESDMRKAMEYFFSIYPYSAYRDCFDVYMVVAISAEEGVSVVSPAKSVNTVFEAKWNGGTSTGLVCNYNKVAEYAALATNSAVGDGDTTVILPINMEPRAGTCQMYPSGFAVAMCPTGAWFEEAVHHEAGGHAFAKLCDEYVYPGYTTTSITDSAVSAIKQRQAAGFYANVSLSGVIASSPWSGFAGNSKYSMVSTFEGAYNYGLGVWRPEQNSCMNDNTAYYNAPSRWAMVRRIKKLSGTDSDYTVSEFMAEDLIPPYPESKTRAPKGTFIPFAPPVFIED